MPATISIVAQLHAVDDMGIEAIDRVEIPEEDIPRILNIVTPVTYVKSRIAPKLHYHIADVYLHHQDSSTTKIIVRYTGHNPAAVSVDDGANFFYASVDGPADGARALAILLSWFHQESNLKKR